MSYGFNNDFTQSTIGGGADNERIDPNNARDVEYKTDVEGLNADGTYKKGIDEFPIFDVDKDEFMNNMEQQRSRLRFKKGSKASQYMSGTRYKRPFYIRHTDETTGKKYFRKVK